MHDGIHELLREVAREGRTVHYAEVGALLDLRMANPRHRALLGLILDDIDRHEASAGRPLLAAVVVRKDLGRPGRGFFACARALGHAPEDERAFWAATLTRVHAYWATG